MSLATLVQNQNVATLLQALGSTQPRLAGATIEARLLSLLADGTATAQISTGKLAGAALALVLDGPEAKQAALQPGSTLSLRIEAGEEPGSPLRATLIEVRPPAQAAASSGSIAPSAAQRQSLRTGVPAASAEGQPGVGATLLASAAGTAATQIAAAAPQFPDAPSPTSLSRPAPASTAVPAAAAPRLDGVATPQAPASAGPRTSPRAVAGPLLGSALANQDGLAPLFANLRGLAQGTVTLIVPKPLLQLADQVLARAVPAEAGPLTGEVLKDVVQRSGVFLEARRSAGTPAAPQADLKAGLIALRAALEPLVETFGGAKPARPQPGGPAGGPASDLAGEAQPASRLSPPRIDGPLALQPIVEPSLQAGEKPVVIAETLLRQTDAALDRISLSQYASLPPEAGHGDAAPPQRWLTEIPLALQSGTAILPLHIEKEPPRRDHSEVGGPLWRVRFALDVEPMGPLQGVVTLQGRSVGVTLWAEREETSRLLRTATPGLEAALLAARFEQGAIDVHTGQPRVMQAAAGQFLDRMS